MSFDKFKLLLHTCCAPCSAGVFFQLNPLFNITAFFYNPNIYPFTERKKREKENQKFCQKYNIPFVHLKTKNNQEWFEKIIGLEQEPEGRQRCLICYTIRLEKTAEYAFLNGFEFFATTLTISPYKKALAINQIGRQIAKKYKLKFYEADFKKNGGFQKGLEIAKRNNLYRQNYCGCKYSIKPTQ